MSSQLPESPTSPPPTPTHPTPPPPTPPPPTPAGPRAQLLARAVEYLTERGLSDISLRELAAALGTSHRMLLYHFGSKEGLFVEVVRHTEHRQQDLLADLTRRGGGTLEDSARAMWQRLRAPELAPLERLFFEIYGQALQGRPYADTFLAEVVEAWIEPVLPALETEGLSSAQARVAARLGLAVVRGLLLDVLATGDGAGVDEAFELFLAATSAHRGG